MITNRGGEQLKIKTVITVEVEHQLCLDFYDSEEEALAMERDFICRCPLEAIKLYKKNAVIATSVERI